jgi:hypothetical protein
MLQDHAMSFAPLIRSRVPPAPRDTVTARPVAEMLEELGGACCPSVIALLEHLIDRHAALESVDRGLSR